MPHHVRELVQRELGQLDWSAGMSKEKLLLHFRMAPTVREMFERDLPDRTFRSADEVLQAVPQSHWQRAEETIEHGTPESHYLQSLAAKFNIEGKTPGFGHIQQGQGQQPTTEQQG